MKQRIAVVATALAAAAVVPLVAPAVASAEPVVPQADTPCAESLNGALTQLLNYTTYVTTYLECRTQPGVGYRWQVFDDPYPSSDRWLSFGPKLILHGEGQRNREIDSGDWVAYPQDSSSQCVAEQVNVVSAGTVGAPQVSAGEPGQPLELQVLPLLFTIELSGYCLWEKA
jgi:hypothetical protein